MHSTSSCTRDLVAPLVGLALAGWTGPGRLDWRWQAGLALAGWIRPGRLGSPWQAGLALAGWTRPGRLDWAWQAGLALAGWTGPGTSHSRIPLFKFTGLRKYKDIHMCIYLL